MSNPVGHTSTPQQELPSLMTAQSSVPNRKLKKKSRHSMKEKEAWTVTEVYPNRFLPPTRANIADLFRLKDNFWYPWREHAGEGYYYTGPEMADVKLRCDLEMRRHFLVFGSPKAIGWIIQEQCPEMDLSSQQFKVLHEYVAGIFRSLKHSFLFVDFYVSLPVPMLRTY